MKMRFAWRVFFLSFVPIALVLWGAFVSTQTFVVDGVKDGLRASLRETHEFISRSRSAFEDQNSRLLNIISNNPRLRAGIDLVRNDRDDKLARETLEGQLIEFGEMLGLDIMYAYSDEGRPLAAVRRRFGRMDVMPLDAIARATNDAGVMSIGDTVYVLSGLPVGYGAETIGELTVGRAFDLAQFGAPVILIRHGDVIGSSVRGYRLGEIDDAMSDCNGQEECDIYLAGESMLSLKADDGWLGADYQLRTLQSAETASEPVQSAVRKVFSIAAVLGLLAVLLVSVVSARSIVRPLTALTNALESAAADGSMPRIEIASSTYEIDHLVHAFNHASTSVREGRERLDKAYTEFIASISQAVDARDIYTAGHSQRVSLYSVATAKEMGVKEELETIRIGALLHEVGKIGIPDEILQKDGPLTDEEFAVMKDHPTIGKHILQQIEAFEPYVPTVELHHENHDGSGYPSGLSGNDIPIEARIVHVADAYDAMVSDRPYRKGMSRAQAIDRLLESSGTQFDPDSVAAFVQACQRGLAADSAEEMDGLRHLAAGLRNDRHDLTHSCVDSTARASTSSSNT